MHAIFPHHFLSNFSRWEINETSTSKRIETRVSRFSRRVIPSWFLYHDDVPSRRSRGHREGRSLSPICHWRTASDIAILINLPRRRARTRSPFTPRDAPRGLLHVHLCTRVSSCQIRSGAGGKSRFNTLFCRLLTPAPFIFRSVCNFIFVIISKNYAHRGFLVRHW